MDIELVLRSKACITYRKEPYLNKGIKSLYAAIIAVVP